MNSVFKRLYTRFIYINGKYFTFQGFLPVPISLKRSFVCEKFALQANFLTFIKSSKTPCCLLGDIRFLTHCFGINKYQNVCGIKRRITNTRNGYKCKN